MSRPPPRFVVAAGPVNRRTTRHGPALSATHPAVQERIEAARNRIQLGAPLTKQTRRHPHRERLGRRHILAALTAAMAVAAIFLGGVQQSWWLLTLAAALLICTGLVLLVRGNASTDAAAGAWLDQAVRSEFDSLLAEIVGAVEPQHCELLCQIKASIAGMAGSPLGGGSDEHFGIDDRHYVIECMRRYLPDSLTAYLVIPKTQRRPAPLISTSMACPADLLSAQLTLLRDELRLREARATRSAAEGLMRQQRFLASKRSVD